MSSLRELVEPDCGGANPLMRLGSHIMRDTAYKDEGLSRNISGPLSTHHRSAYLEENQLVNEFLGQVSQQPMQTFRMDELLQEMREIEGFSRNNVQQQSTPAHASTDEQFLASGGTWSNEFFNNNKHPNELLNDQSQQLPQSTNAMIPYTPNNVMHHHQQQQISNKQFFDNLDTSTSNNDIQHAANDLLGTVYGNSNAAEQFKYSEFMRFMENVGDGSVKIDNGQVINQIYDEGAYSSAEQFLDKNTNAENWIEDFRKHNHTDVEETEKYNAQFWGRLQDEWKRIAENEEHEHPWLSEFGDYYEPYKEYSFDEENPMIEIENAFERGKQFLENGDIPSAVLCFESAVKKDPNNAEIWELLGTSQAENEKDPNAIAALKKSLELNPNNLNVLMALAIAYTNESLQSHALKMLIRWLQNNPKYKHLITSDVLSATEDSASVASSLIRGPDLREIQNLYLQAVQENPTIVDADIQEALGVLFNLSSEYEKAVDCFRAACSIRPTNAKTWNRLGASLANGNRSIEAVEAYQRALEIQPGFVRVRYNVGIICINLKSYNEAVQHFLTALNHQATSMERSNLSKINTINQMSDTIWSTLRMVISLIGRIDLQQAVDTKNLQSLNAAFNMDE